jgi:sporulation protein YhbH
MSIREDHRRFRDIIKGRIKQNFKKYVTQSEMIGKQENEFVKIPVPSIEIPRFRYGPKDQGGVGQGQGQPGDSLNGEKGEGRGQAGESPGQHLIEVDVSLDELADILGEELELPKIQPKGNKTIETEQTKYTGRAPVGPNSLRLFKQSYKQALRRLIAEGNYAPDDPVVVPLKEDIRYRTVKKVTRPQANAVVIYMMDVSGSMGDEQKEVVRLESFWINTWLRRNYRGLETRFIIHDAAAKEVDEKTFFSTSESGGTLISSAYKLAKQVIEADYPPSAWNIYPFHFSDGDNWSGEDTRVCLNLLKEFFLPNVNMFGYGQVESKYGSGQFLKDLEKVFAEDDRLVMSKIENREKIMQSIKEFLGRGR